MPYCINCGQQLPDAARFCGSCGHQMGANAGTEPSARTEIELEISNQCGRLIANAIIYCNSAILSRLLTRYEANGYRKTSQTESVRPSGSWSG